MDKISIIMPCHNQLEYTKISVESIQKNTDPERYNFIFIDNGSTDGTHEYLKSIKNSEIITNKENVFVNKAWNQGFDKVKEKYCCLANNDIRVGKNWLNGIFKAFETRYGEVYIPASNVEPEPDFTEEKYYVSKHEFKPFKETFPGFLMIFKSSLIRLFYPIPEQLKILHGDDWIFDHLYHHGYTPTKCYDCPVYHFISMTQRKMNLGELHNRDHDEWEKIKNTIYKKKNMERIQHHTPAARML